MRRVGEALLFGILFLPYCILWVIILFAAAVMEVFWLIAEKKVPDDK